MEASQCVYNNKSKAYQNGSKGSKYGYAVQGKNNYPIKKFHLQRQSAICELDEWEQLDSGDSGYQGSESFPSEESCWSSSSQGHRDCYEGRSRTTGGETGTCGCSTREQRTVTNGNRTRDFCDALPEDHNNNDVNAVDQVVNDVDQAVNAVHQVVNAQGNHERLRPKPQLQRSQSSTEKSDNDLTPYKGVERRYQSDEPGNYRRLSSGYHTGRESFETEDGENGDGGSVFGDSGRGEDLRILLGRNRSEHANSIEGAASPNNRRLSDVKICVTPTAGNVCHPDDYIMEGLLGGLREKYPEGKPLDPDEMRADIIADPNLQGVLHLEKLPEDLEKTLRDEKLFQDLVNELTIEGHLIPGDAENCGTEAPVNGYAADQHQELERPSITSDDLLFSPETTPRRSRAKSSEPTSCASSAPNESMSRLIGTSDETPSKPKEPNSRPRDAQACARTSDSQPCRPTAATSSRYDVVQTHGADEVDGEMRRLQEVSVSSPNSLKSFQLRRHDSHDFCFSSDNDSSDRSAQAEDLQQESDDRHGYPYNEQTTREVQKKLEQWAYCQAMRVGWCDDRDCVEAKFYKEALKHFYIYRMDGQSTIIKVKCVAKAYWMHSEDCRTTRCVVPFCKYFKELKTTEPLNSSEKPIFEEFFGCLIAQSEIDMLKKMLELQELQNAVQNGNDAWMADPEALHCGLTPERSLCRFGHFGVVSLKEERRYCEPRTVIIKKLNYSQDLTRLLKMPLGTPNSLLDFISKCLWYRQINGEKVLVCSTNLPGKDLTHYIDSRTCDSLKKEFMHQAIAAAIELNGRRIIYLNWKLSHLIWDSDKRRLKLCNFSCAVEMKCHSGSRGLVAEDLEGMPLPEHVRVGLDPRIAPPEVLEGVYVSPKSDTWGLGCLLYQLRNGGCLPYPEMKHDSDDVIREKRLTQQTTPCGIFCQIWKRQQHDRPLPAKILDLLDIYNIF